jgi:type IV secretion system protein VirB9
MKAFALALALLGMVAPLTAEVVPPLGALDSRAREVVYQADQVYRLRGAVGYHVHLEFERGEEFVGLGAGDVEGVDFLAMGSHLFLKPKAAPMATNLTVLTNRRVYLLDYSVAEPDSQRASRYAMFSLRFIYPAPPVVVPVASAQTKAPQVETLPINSRYAFCGSRSLRPVAAWDDGVQTHLEFGGRQELPAVFVRDEEGGEALVNFSVRGTEMVLHRVAEKFVLRRGRLRGCVWNRGFDGGGAARESQTVVPGATREVIGGVP